MGTITKTVKENQTGSSNAATWTFTVTGSNFTVSGSSFTFTTPTVKAKYSGSGKGYAWTTAELTDGFTVTGGNSFGSDLAWYTSPRDNYIRWASGAEKTLTKSSSSFSVSTSSVFNANNKTQKTVNYTRGFVFDIFGWSAKNSSGSSAENGAYAEFGGGALGTITLNAPPTFTATATSSAPYFANISRYKVNLANLSAKYGGTISNAVLTVGSQTVSRTTNGELSIALNTAGTFTPSVKVTDSRGQVTTVNLSAITVNTHTSPTISAETLSVAPYYTTGTTYTAETSNATAYDGTSISSISLAIGSQTVTRTTDGQLSISPNRAGTFTPTVTIVDSAGASSAVQLSSIQVAQYTSPSMNGMSIRRTESSGKPNEEETSAVIGYQLTWVEDLGHIQRPKLYIDDSTTEATVTWYKTYDITTSPYLNNPISDWTTISSGDIVYAFISGAFPIANSYSISSVVSDDYATSAVLVMTLAQAFFTIDFLAGGKGIAFGQLASNDGFYCNMDAHFKDKAKVMRALFDFVYPVGSYYETSDASFNPNNTWGGTWVLEESGRVHVSAGTGYTIGSTGGSKDAIIPYHRHSVAKETISGGSHAHDIYYRTGTNIGSGSAGWWVLGSSKTHTGTNSTTIVSSTHSHDVPAHNTDYTGSSVTNANMQPYIVVNRWHRTA